LIVDPNGGQVRSPQNNKCLGPISKVSQSGLGGGGKNTVGWKGGAKDKEALGLGAI